MTRVAALASPRAYRVVRLGPLDFMIAGEDMTALRRADGRGTNRSIHTTGNWVPLPYSFPTQGLADDWIHERQRRQQILLDEFYGHTK